MRILLVGHGRMGRLVGELASEYGCEVVGVIDPNSPLHAGGPDQDRWRGVDVAIDFSFPDAVKPNVPALARHGGNMWIGRRVVRGTNPPFVRRGPQQVLESWRRQIFLSAS